MTPTEQSEVIAEIEQAVGAEVSFEPIWSTRHGRYQGFYALLDDPFFQVRLMVPGATRLDAAVALLDDVRATHPELFRSPAIAAE